MREDKKERILFIVSTLICFLTSLAFVLFFFFQSSPAPQDYMLIYQKELAINDAGLVMKKISKDLEDRTVSATPMLVQVLVPFLENTKFDEDFRLLCLSFLKRRPNDRAVLSLAYASAQAKSSWAFAVFSAYPVVSSAHALSNELSLNAKQSSKSELLRMLKSHKDSASLGVLNRVLTKAYLGDLSGAQQLHKVFLASHLAAKEENDLLSKLISYDLESFEVEQVLDKFLTLSPKHSFSIVNRLLDLSIVAKRPDQFIRNFEVAINRQIQVSPIHQFNYQMVKFGSLGSTIEPKDSQKAFFSDFIQEKKDVRALKAWLLESYLQSRDVRMLRLLAYYSIQMGETDEIMAILAESKDSKENWSLFYRSILFEEQSPSSHLGSGASVFHPLADAYLLLNKSRLEILNNRNTAAIADLKEAIKHFRVVSLDQENVSGSTYGLIWSDFLALASRIYQTAGDKQKASKDFSSLDTVLPEHSQLFYAEKLLPNDSFIDRNER